MDKLKSYIGYIGLVCLRVGLCVFHIFPIRKNRIMFYSFNGKQYSCNPRKISEGLHALTVDEYEIYWAFKKPESFTDILPEYVKPVKYRSLKYYYLAKTSKVIVQNVQGVGELKRRKGQVIIQTWHASNGYKKVGTHLKGIKRKANLLGHKDYSYVLAGCQNMENNRVRKSMNFKGEVIKGTPRMDVMFNLPNEKLEQEVYDWLKLDRNKRIMLYAPTWRNNRDTDKYDMDYKLVKNALEEKFDGEWIIAVRLHPNVKTKPDTSLPYVVDATKYPDMEELLETVDALISDYSSCVWDFSFTNRPCFLYCTDIKEYDSERSFDIPIEKWGFAVCENSNELATAISDFDVEAYSKLMDEHHREMGNFEDGHATERVCGLIDKICRG